MKKTLLWAVLLCMASVLPMSAQSTCNHQYDSDDQTHCTLCNHYFVHYTSTDGNIVKPLGAKPFGEAAIVSNTYENGRGIIELDNVPTAIGAGAYNEVETLKTFEFPKTIESIGNLAFMCCTGLTTISEFPSTLKSIGRYGFYACLNLGGELVLPNSVTFLDSFVFGGCHYVTKITIPESITEIPNHAFEYCKRLKTVVLPESLITIGVDAFRNCYVLEEQVIPNSVQTIKDGAFSDCPLLASVNIPKSLVTIERNAFKGSPKLNIKMDMPNTLVSIGDYAFYNCTSINSELVLGNSLTTIGRYAFYNCTGLHGALTIPNSVTEIDSRAFKNCTGFTGTLSIGDKLTELRDSVFANCSGFENVIVGKSVNDIAKSFIGCTGVKTVHFKNTTPATFYNIGFNDQYVCFYVPESALSTYRADKNWKYAFYDRLFIEPCKHEYTQENPYYCTKCKHYLVHYTTDNGTFLHTPWRDDVKK
ncbi:MAG: leucine-rich repeat domain-containing protein [Bacteroidales bacterium]|nr:leucine-rich repeat domain-containing protein [Bacteroidales bacterium]